MDEKTYLLTWEELTDHGNGSDWVERYEVSDCGFDWELKHIAKVLTESEYYFNKLPERFRVGRQWTPPIRNIQLAEITPCSNSNILAELDGLRQAKAEALEEARRKQAIADREAKLRQLERLRAELEGEG